MKISSRSVQSLEIFLTDSDNNASTKTRLIFRNRLQGVKEILQTRSYLRNYSLDQF